MYYSVANKLVVTSGTMYTQAVSMAGGNAVYVEGVAYSANVVTTIEEGNDLENWSVGTTATISTGYGTMKYTGIASQYVRLRLASASTTVFGAGINVANL